jgi:hypothetical protein
MIASRVNCIIVENLPYTNIVWQLSNVLHIVQETRDLEV